MRKFSISMLLLMIIVAFVTVSPVLAAEKSEKCCPSKQVNKAECDQCKDCACKDCCKDCCKDGKCSCTDKDCKCSCKDSTCKNDKGSCGKGKGKCGSGK